uniref:Putative phospholipid-transporting atp n=1 Tax=Ixodes ricinus TaxID=34613 RepID=A0A0K8RA25_IXORI
MFTAAPPLAIGLFDRTCSAEVMMKYPALYKSSQNAEGFNAKVFWVWIFDAIYHSIILFWLTMLGIKQDVAWPNGRDGGYLMFGNLVYTYVVVTVCLKAGLEIELLDLACPPGHLGQHRHVDRVLAHLLQRLARAACTPPTWPDCI